MLALGWPPPAPNHHAQGKHLKGFERSIKSSRLANVPEDLSDASDSEGEGKGKGTQLEAFGPAQEFVLGIHQITVMKRHVFSCIGKP